MMVINPKPDPPVVTILDSNPDSYSSVL
jgi:hypothetical protein